MMWMIGRPNTEYRANTTSVDHKTTIRHFWELMREAYCNDEEKAAVVRCVCVLDPDCCHKINRFLLTFCLLLWLLGLQPAQVKSQSKD